MLNGLDLSGYLSIIGYARQTTEGDKMSNYPEGSMRGSGIYSYDYEEDRVCESGYELEDGTICNFEGTVTVLVDDWGTHRWECPKCDYEHEIDVEGEDPRNEYEPDRFMD
jgi:hypothetical protein